MLGNLAPTPFDLRFPLFGIPVRVHPTFWLAGALWGWEPDNFNYTLVFIACFFLSILIHEAGHALMAICFGGLPQIILYAFGGLTSFQRLRGYTALRDVAVSFAGPAAGFLLFFVVAGIRLLAREQGWNLPEYVRYALYQLWFMNLWWNVFNLIPVYPLDGGQIARAILVHLRPRDGLAISLKLSLLVAVVGAAYFFQTGMRFAAILFAMLAVESLQYLQGSRYR